MEKLPFLDKTMLTEINPVDDVVVSYIKNIASLYKVPDQDKFLCRNCKVLPEPPVTGRCGHTRCLRCIKENNRCSCGIVTEDFSVNIVIRDLIKQMMSKLQKWNDVNCGLSPKNDYKEIWTVLDVAGPDGFQPEDLPFDKEQLISILPYLARASNASTKSIKSCIANTMLKEGLGHLKSHPFKNLLFREVLRSLKRVSPLHWFSQSDLECPICCEVFGKPITISCGHTYCFSCLENLINHRKPCALCLKPIQELNLSEVNVTEFISEILSCMQVHSSNDIIPILTGISAVPCMCCLIKIKPPQTFMIEKVMQTHSKTFGLIDWTHDDYGTIVEIKDCVLLEDGSVILTTIGTRRFQIVNRFLLDGYECARIELLCDKVIKESRTILRKLIELESLSYMWLNKLSPEIKNDIMQTYGFFGTYEFNENSLQTPDGPSSLWWLTEVLPLHPKLKADLLVCTDLYKRMMILSRMLSMAVLAPASDFKFISHEAK